MSGPMVLLILLGLAIFFVLAVVWMINRDERSSQLSKQQRKELVRLRRLVETIDAIAYENREIDPYTAPLIVQEISKFKREIG